MRFSFYLPDLGEGLAEAELVEWHASVGAGVVEDGELVEVQTDKAIVAVPSPVTGTLIARHGEEGDTIAVGALLAVFETATAAATAETPSIDPPPAAAPERTSPGELVHGPAASTDPTAPVTPTKVAASPSVRRQARERGIDIVTLQGTGPGGRILAADLDRPAGGPPARSAPDPVAAPVSGDQEIPMRGIRKATARTMAAGWREIPHIFDFREADAERLMRLRSALRSDAERAGDVEGAAALSPLALLIKIAAAALAKHPEIHGYVDASGETIIRHAEPHLGIAVATPDGLLTPVLRDVNQLSVREIGLGVRELADQAMSRRLTSQQLSGATFLVNNLGALGTWYGTPLIPPGLGGNLGLGRVVERPVVRDGQVVPGKVMPLSISADHRLIDGDVLAAFAATMVRLIENPQLLMGGLR